MSFKTFGLAALLALAPAAAFAAEFGIREPLPPPKVRMRPRRRPAPHPRVGRRVASKPAPGRPRPAPSSSTDLPEREPNDAEQTPMLVPAGSRVAARFSFEKSYTDTDRYLVDVSQPGRHEISASMALPGARFGFASDMTSGVYAKGTAVLTIENLGGTAERTKYRVTEACGGRAPKTWEMTSRARDKLLITLENTAFGTRSGSSGREIQLERDGPWLTAVGYTLSFGAP